MRPRRTSRHSRYQFGDWTPYIYRTEDFGRRWELITDGIPEDFPVRVVREDPEREGLLFAGTEYGMFVSFDDGDNWQEFQQNLGVTPVTDIKVVRGDLAISTMGRSYWVLDNISTLRQPAFESAASEALLFRPKETIRYRNIYRGSSPNGVPDYPPPAAIIDYYLPDGFDGEVTLEILDGRGERVNAYTSTGEEGEDEVVEDMNVSQTRVIADQSLSAEPGMNRFRWNMTHFGPWDEDEDDRYTNGPMARPGTYTLRLTAGDTTAVQALTLVTDPRVLAQGTTEQDIDDQVSFLLVVADLLSDVRQFEQRVAEEHADLESRSDELTPDEAARLIVVTDVLNEVKTKEIIYPQPMLTAQVGYLYRMVNGADQAPGVDAADRLVELNAWFARLKDQYGQ